jgi:hypothetical protein
MSFAGRLYSQNAGKRARAARIIVALSMFGRLISIYGQGGISQEGDLTLLRSGGNEALITLDVPLGQPAATPPAVLRFDFGFTTDEPDTPDTFFDSFSVTVQGDDVSESALLFTADRTGIDWAPENPGGVTISSNDVQHVEQPFAKEDEKLAVTFAYSVVFTLPQALLGGAVKVLFDLFANLNAAASLAYVRQVRLSGAIRLQAADLAGGTYADEATAVLDETKRSFTLAKPQARRFFRVVADRTLRIVKITPGDADLVVEYAPVQLRLQSASEVKGPYADEPSATLDELNRTLAVEKRGASRFYRVAADVALRIKAVRRNGNKLVLEYEFNP